MQEVQHINNMENDNKVKSLTREVAIHYHWSQKGHEDDEMSKELCDSIKALSSYVEIYY